MDSYEALKDNELVEMVRNDDEKAFDVIVCRYSEFIHFKARFCVIRGGDEEDAFQEGLIALYRAVFSYDASRGVSFSTYAITCVAYALSRITRYNMRMKRYSGQADLSYEDKIAIASDQTLSLAESPESYVVRRDLLSALYDGMDKLLNEKEKRIMLGRLGGASYKELADMEKLEIRKIYNAIESARKKINTFFNADDYLDEFID